MKCPHCEKPITRIVSNDVAINMGNQAGPGLAHCCPDCDAIITVQLDPRAMNDDLLDDLKKAIS